jgi:pilus assembly protein FimV
VASGGSKKGSESRLEIVPPSGKASARGAQSGAAAGAGGVELRAELVQAQEDLAARASEVTELKSRVADMEKQDADRQRLLEMKDSQLHALESRLKQLEAANNAASPDSVAVSALPASVERTPAPTSKSKPVATTAEQWYLSPFMLGGGALVVLGGLVLALRRSKSGAQSEVPGHRLSDDDALRASLAQARAGSTAGHIVETPEPLPMAEEETAEPESERHILEAAVRSRPKDLEAHLSLLRYFYAENSASDYEIAAQTMRLQVGNTMDPRWREAVIMGAALIPDNILFSQVDWNSPRMSAIDPALASASPATENADPSAVADNEGSSAQDWDALFAAERNATNEAADIPPAEAGAAEDDASATRVELAKAYLNIGDLEGARSMLEEVLAEGSETAKAEAERILREIG